MLVLSNSPGVARKVLEADNSFSWYQAPSSPGDCYAREYWHYMKAAVSGDTAARRSAEQKLKAIPVKRIYRNSLPIT
jgi:hypothetical protein